jgi:hypothetical protein
MNQLKRTRRRSEACLLPKSEPNNKIVADTNNKAGRKKYTKITQ